MSTSSSSSDISIDVESVSSVRATHGPERGRGRGRRGRGKQPAGTRGRGRGKGKRSARHLEAVPEIPSKEEKIELLKQEISSLTREELVKTIHRLVEVEPGVVHYVMRPSQRPEGGYHPQPNQPTPGWCVCGYCREMPTSSERVCCRKHNCISRTERFETLILDEGVLAMGRLLRRDILVFPDEDLGEEGDDLNTANRFYAYQQFTLWRHGRLGAGNRIPIPSCCVWRIRDKFPHPFGQYVGFQPARI